MTSIFHFHLHFLKKVKMDAAKGENGGSETLVSDSWYFTTPLIFGQGFSPESHSIMFPRPQSVDI